MLSLQFSTLKGGLGDLTCNNNKQESSSSSIEVAAILESVWKKMRLSLSKRPILYQEQVIFSSLGQWTQRTPDDDVSQLFSKKDYNIEEQIEIEQKNFGEIFQLVEPKSPPKPSNQPTGGEEKIISHFSPAFWHKPTSSLPNDAAEYMYAYNGMAADGHFV